MKLFSSCIILIHGGIARPDIPAREVKYISDGKIDCTGLYVIKNLEDFSARDKKNLQQTLHAMKQIPSQYDATLNAYDYFPYAHKEVAINSSTFLGGRPVHGSWWFLPWHREFLYRMGQELQRSAKHIGITDPVHFAVWNMSDESVNDLFFRDDYMGGSGQFRAPHDLMNYALMRNDNHPFGPQTGWVIPEELRFLHAEKASGGSLVRVQYGNGQLGCLDAETRSKHFKLPGADNPPVIDSYDVVQFAGGTRLDPLEDFYGTPDPANMRCDRADANCDKYFTNTSTNETIICHNYGGMLPTWKEMRGCELLPFEDDVNYNFSTLPTFMSACLEGMNAADPFSLPGEMAGASWHSPHGKTHAYTGGTSGESPASANDPIFFGIHATIDYLWFQAQLRNDFMDPWFVKHPEMLDLRLPFFGTKIRDAVEAVRHYGFAYNSNCEIPDTISV